MHSIYVEYSHKGDRYRVNTTIKLPSDQIKYFNKEATLNPFGTGVKQKEKLNCKFNDIYNQLNQVFDQNKLSPLDVADFKLEFESQIEAQANFGKQSRKDLFELLDEYKLRRYKRDSSQVLTKGSVKARNSHLAVFAKFLKEKNIDFLPASVNTKLYNRFRDWCYEENNFEVNYFAALVKDIKPFFEFVISEESISLPNYLKEKWVKPSFKPKDPLYLLEEELELIRNFDESELSDKLKKTKDLVVFQALTGLRISDLKKLSKENYIKSQDFNRLDLIQQKNNKPYKMPLDPLADSIFVKYDFRLPTKSDQKHNEDIKELCQLIGLDRVLQIRTNQGGVLKTINRKLYEVISSHDMVHTFCTLKIARGITPKTLSTIIGKDVKTIIDHYYGQDLVDLEKDLIKTF